MDPLLDHSLDSLTLPYGVRTVGVASWLLRPGVFVVPLLDRVVVALNLGVRAPARLLVERFRHDRPLVLTDRAHPPENVYEEHLLVGRITRVGPSVSAPPPPARGTFPSASMSSPLELLLIVGNNSLLFRTRRQRKHSSGNQKFQN